MVLRGVKDNRVKLGEEIQNGPRNSVSDSEDVCEIDSLCEDRRLVGRVGKETGFTVDPRPSV